MLIARPIPENSILEIVRGFSARDRGVELAILGKYDPTADSYHQEGHPPRLPQSMLGFSGRYTNPRR